MIYFDNSATTRVDANVAQYAVAVMTGDYGNPSSLHRMGTEALNLLTSARHRIAQALGAHTRNVYFTSGGSEANNLAILGAMETREGGIVTTAIEHSSVLDVCRHLQEKGHEVAFIAPRADGLLHAQDMVDAVDDETALVSMMAVNNETGAMLPLQQSIAAIREKNPKTLIHVDFVQGFCKIPLKLHEIPVDLLTVSAHKIHGPKGAGALYVREGLALSPLTFGGGQESKVRPGTENVPAWAAFGLAAEKALEQLRANAEQVKKVRAALLTGLSTLPFAQINSPQDGSAYLLNVSLCGFSSEELLHALGRRQIYLSSSAACTRGATSHVLQAMHLSEARCQSALRIGLSKHNTIDEANALIQALREITDEAVA